MVTVQCPGCSNRLKVKDEWAGRKGRCPACGRSVEVPSASAPERDPDAPPASIPGILPRQGTPPTLWPDAPIREKSPVELWDFLALPLARDELGRLGNYRVLKILGAGGMGVVYHAEDLHLKRAVALKAMLPALAASESNRLRFLREAQAAAAIEHDHIVTIYQVGEDRGVPFLAMQLLQGETLEDRLQRVGQLETAEVLRLGREIAEGLQAAHERGLIHRDIKPSNIWLESGRDRVKILDFGLARAMGGDSKLTQMGAVVGTPAYMSPEQANSKPVDARTDLFSLGCILYRACTGELPFKGSDTLATLTALALHTPEPAATINPATPPALSLLIERLMAKKLDDRPVSARAVVEAITAIERNAPTALLSGVRKGSETFLGVELIEDEEPPADALTARARERAPARTEMLEEAPRPRRRRVIDREQGMSPLVWAAAGLGAVAVVAAVGVGLFLLLGGVRPRTPVPTPPVPVVISKPPAPGPPPGPPPPRVFLTLNQPGVAVFIDGQQVGVTPENGQLLVELTPGFHELRLSKDGFATTSRRIHAVPGGMQNISTRLSPLGLAPPPVRPPDEPVAQDGPWREGNRVNLIDLIDLSRDVVHGRWVIENRQLRCLEPHFVPRIQIPYAPPEEYDFVVTFQQLAIRNGVSLVMPRPSGGGNFFWFIGSEQGRGYGFHADVQRSGNRPIAIQLNNVHTTKVEVRKEGVRGYLDDVLLVNHPTKFTDLTMDGWRKIPDLRRVAVCCDDPTHFSRAEIIEVSGRGTRLR